MELLTETFDDFRQRAFELVKDLENSALMDELTSTLNRNAFEKRKVMLCDKNNLLPIGIIYFDINGLHYINKTQGHEAGDFVIIDMAKMLKSYWGSIDTYRIGGDEFVVIQLNVKPLEFKNQVSEFVEILELTHRFNVSVGYSIADSDKSLEDAIKEADSSMLKSKCKYYREHREYR